ncbi:uncharacterized protein LOC133194680 [Saccostrea echinata]|uniref:uncharacterized protein LOC133194680 n=1 Tax=Saccostrea echinata TaxID=191078 RepID=UPI002A82CDD0|nr:uncharacterized protein LOC133194680 [Saccostrea echinata]
MHPASAITKVREFSVYGVESVSHISLDQSGKLWISDNNENLIQTDQQGNQLQGDQLQRRIKTNGEDEGYHAVKQDGELVFTDRYKRVVNRITVNNYIVKFIKTGDWEPISVYSSHINGDILVGMVKGKKAKITRYNKTGDKILDIQKKNLIQRLYGEPHYITENQNGDICVSDNDKEAVVVVNKSGHYRFSYRGQQEKFLPQGICTDALGHILVCDFYDSSIHLLDQDGQFLFLLLKEQPGVSSPQCVCVDKDDNLYVGKNMHTTVTVYKYL